MAATTLLLVRHAAHERVDRMLCGRMPGVHLGADGRAQAARLAEWLARREPRAIHASPQPRAQETAAPVAARCGLPLRTAPALDEIDFGEWTGQEFAALAGDPRWQRWNAFRATQRAPGGESMIEAQARALGWARSLPARHPDAVVVAVSHADVIKALIAGVLGLSLDAHARFAIDPASISTVVLWESGGMVLRMNEVPA